MVVINPVPFEEALNMAGFGKYNMLAFLTNVILMAAMTFETMSVAYLVPMSACEFHTTSAQQGLMTGVPILGTIASSHFIGYLADTQGRRKVLGWSMCFAFVVGLSATFSPNWIVFCILKFLSYTALAGVMPVSLALISECTPQQQRPIIIALNSSVYCGSAGVMAVLAIPILQLKFSYYLPYIDIHFTSWRLLNIVFASSCALGAAAVFLSYESSKYFLSVDKEEKALGVLRKIFVINSGKSSDNYYVSSLVLGEDTGMHTKGFFSTLVYQTLPLLKPPLLKNTILLSVLFIIIYAGTSPFLLWMPYMLDAVMKSKDRGDRTFCEMLQSTDNTTVSENYDCSLDTFAMITVSLMSVTIAVCNVFLGFVINYVGRKRMVIAVQLIAGTAGLCINATHSWIISTISLIFYMMAMVNFGFLSGFSVELFPTYVKAMAVCLTLMVGRASSFAGINVFKNMLNTNCELAIYGFGGFVFAGGLIAFLLPSDVKEPKKYPSGPTKL